MYWSGWKWGEKLPFLGHQKVYIWIYILTMSNHDHKQIYICSHNSYRIMLWSKIYSSIHPHPLMRALCECYVLQSAVCIIFLLAQFIKYFLRVTIEDNSNTWILQMEYNFHKWMKSIDSWSTWLYAASVVWILCKCFVYVFAFLTP